MANKWTRAHYEATAAVLRDALSNALSAEEQAGIGYAVSGMANMYAADNPRFSHQRFYDAVYGTDPEIVYYARYGYTAGK